MRHYLWGQPSSQYEGSSATLGQDRKAGVSYSINPFAGEDGTGVSGSLAPVPSAVFANYWNSGWPPEVLLALMVERATIYRNDKADKALINRKHEGKHDFLDEVKDKATSFTPNDEKASLRDWSVKPGLVTAQGECTMIDPPTVRRLMGNSNGSPMEYMQGMQELDKLVDGSIKIMPAKATKQLAPHICPSPTTQVALVHKDDPKGDRIYIVVELRSLDGMIYFVGESMREKAFKVKGPKDKDNKRCDSTPLMTVYDKKQEGDFAVSTKHLGKTVYAVKRTNGDVCPDDRSQTVMTILNQVFHISQSKDFLKAPDDIFRRQ